MRKVIQISSSVVPESDYDTKHQVTTALCDDGTMWAIVDLKEWKQLPPIPQPEIVADEVMMPNVGDIIFVFFPRTLDDQVCYFDNFTHKVKLIF